MPPPQADWHQELASAFRRTGDLLQFLKIEGFARSAQAERDFPTLVTRHYAERMQAQNRHDPLLLQVLAQGAETLDVPGFGADPVGDSLAVRTEGVLQKYRGRVLVMPTGACAIHCRHCFRRAFPYADLHTQGLPGRLERYLDEHEDVEEVILSGGDPLLLEDLALKDLLGVIGRAARVKRLRIHTRIPLVLPSRFTPELMSLLASPTQEKIFVVHANHAQELCAQSASAFATLRATGWTLLNQSVLLRGVNDSAQVLADLAHKLLAQGVLPYYLHQLDRVQGAAHFEVPIAEGLRIMKELGAMLPGYLVPRYVQEIAGEAGKTLL